MKPLELYGLENIAKEADTPEKEEILAQELAQHMLAFLQSGVSWNEWCSWSKTERYAVYLAGAKLDAYRAYQTGRASHDLKSALEVLADYDGGEAHDDYVAVKVVLDA